MMIDPMALAGLRRYENWLIRKIPLFFFITTAIGFGRLALMQLNDMAFLGGAILTFLYAFCALMYSRAQGTDIDKMQATRAADQCFKACLISTLTYAIAFWAFGLLSLYYVPIHLDLTKSINDVEEMAWPPLLASAAIYFLFIFPICIRLQMAVDFTIKNIDEHLVEP